MANNDLIKEKPSPCVLIALDGSKSSTQALEYAVGLTGIVSDLKMVLMTVMPQTPPLYKAEAKTDGAMLARLRKLEQVNKKKGREILDKARDYLVEKNISPDRIEVRLVSRMNGLAKDLVNQAELGHFDSLILGRRGLTRAQEVFMGSVSNQVIQHAANVPLWIIDGKVKKPNVLVAIDGSEASLRAVDHVAFILGHNPEAFVDFLHITPKLQNFCSINLEEDSGYWDINEDELGDMEEEFRRNDSICMDDFFEKAIKIMKNAGFSSDRIKVEQREISLGIARTIVKAAKEGGYGTIVLGRRGMGKSAFLGTTSDRVIRRADDIAVWLVN